MLLAAKQDTIVIGRMQFQLLSDSGAWRTDTTRIALPVQDIRSLEVQGWRSHRGEGMVIGAAGMGLPAFLFVKSGEKAQCGFDPVCWKPGHAGQAAIIGSVAGFFVAAMVGDLWRTQEWQRVPLERLEGLRIRLVPQPYRRLGLGASASF